MTDAVASGPAVEGKLKVTVGQAYELRDPNNVFVAVKARKKAARKAREAGCEEPGAEMMDTFVAILVNGEKGFSEVVEGTDAPYYGKTWEFSGEFTAATDVVLEIKRSHRAEGLDDTSIGMAVVPLGQRVKGGNTSEVSSFAPKGSDTAFGKADVTLDFEQTGFAKVKAAAKEDSAVTSGPDFVDGALVKLEGPRPGALRTEWYYATVKGAYLFFAGLPLLRIAAPHLENIVEAVLMKTPLKPSADTPEASDSQEHHKATSKLDKSIEKTLMNIDDAVDSKKDDCIKGLIGLKNNVKGLKPADKGIVEASVDGVKSATSQATGAITSTVGNTYNNITGFIGGIWGKTYDTVTSTASGAYHKTTETAFNTVDGVKGMVGGAVHKVGEVTDQAVSNVKGVVGGVVHKTQEVAGGIAHKTQEVAGGIAHKTQEVAGGIVHKAGEVADGVTTNVKGVVSDVGSKVGLGGGSSNGAASTMTPQQ